MKKYQILFTGGSGLLGSEMKRLLPNVFYPSSSEFNVINYQQMKEYIKEKNIGIIIHAAAFTSPPSVDKEPGKAIDVNIIGTSNVVKLCLTNQIRLMYISTDYVFKGDKGNYKEQDPVSPVNKYAWSKLGGECAVKMYENSLIVRTSFGPNEFPYPKAFIDQWTSRESVRNIVEKIAALVNKHVTGVVHIGGKRQSVYEYAKSIDRAKKIGQLSINEISFTAPRDTSLCCNYYDDIMKGKK